MRPNEEVNAMDLATATDDDASRVRMDAVSVITRAIERASLPTDTQTYPQLAALRSDEVSAPAQRSAAALIAIPGLLFILAGLGTLRATPLPTQAQGVTLCGGLCILALAVLTKHRSYACAPTNDFPRLVSMRVRHEISAVDADAMIELALLAGALTDPDVSDETLIARLVQCTSRPRFPLPSFRELVAAWRSTPELLPVRIARLRAL